MRLPLKILHTADLHLGAKFVGLGSRGADQRRRLREVLGDIVKVAGKERVNLILFSGDTFDSNTPSPESVSAFKHALVRLDEMRIPVIMIAGTHDHLAENAILSRLETETSIVFLKPEQSLWENAELNVLIQGVSLINSHQPERPLAAWRRTDSPFWQIGMAHASLEIEKKAEREACFSPREIKAAGLDYIALGHWHNQRDCSEGGVACWYSGSPEMIAMDESGSGSVLVVYLEYSKPPVITAHRVGKRSLLRITAEACDTEKTLAMVRSQADPEAVLELTLSGLISPEIKPDLEEIKRALKDHFFYIRLRDDSSITLSPEELGKYPGNTVIGRFIRLVQEEMSGSDPGRREELEQALQMGCAMLSGREVIPWS